MNKLYIAMLAVLSLMSCSDNLFGSSGGSSNCGKDIKCLRLEAENAFRRGTPDGYRAAHSAYSKIVSIDSTASVGYFGMAKAGLWMEGVNPFEVFSYVKLDSSIIPFVGDPINIKNKYLQGMRSAAVPLSNLQRRDSLTVLYERHMKDKQSSDSSLIRFREAFCKPEPCRDTTGEKRHFPLSDREYKYNTYQGGFLISTMAKAILDFFDTNGDGCITRRGTPGIDKPFDNKWNLWGCKGKENEYDLPIKLIKKDGVITIELNILNDLEEVMVDYYAKQDEPRCKNITNDVDEEYCNEIPSELVGLNNKLESFTGSIEEVIDILNTVGMKDECEDEIGGTCEEGDWQEEINKYKEYATFFRVGTRIDEDGDGCIDEDLLNGLDNDGDGVQGANARIARTDPADPLSWGVTNMMGFHSMTGNPDDDKPIKIPVGQNSYVCNDKLCNNKNFLYPTDEDEDKSHVTVIAFTRKPGYWTSDDLEEKLRVAQDTVCPPKISLQQRRDRIGGCWLFYDEEKFVKYWLKRGLALPSVRATRVHPSCQKCEGLECL